MYMYIFVYTYVYIYNVYIYIYVCVSRCISAGPTGQQFISAPRHGARTWVAPRA